MASALDVAAWSWPAGPWPPQGAQARVQLDLLGGRLVGQLLGLDPGRGRRLVGGAKRGSPGRAAIWSASACVLVAEVDQVARPRPSASVNEAAERSVSRTEVRSWS